MLEVNGKSLTIYIMFAIYLLFVMFALVFFGSGHELTSEGLRSAFSFSDVGGKWLPIFILAIVTVLISFWGLFIFQGKNNES